MAGFLTNIDIYNRAMQHLGQTLVVSTSDNSRQVKECNAAYDKLRGALLQSSPWRFASRRAYVYPYTTTTKRFIPNAWVASTAYAVGQIVMDTNGLYWSCVFAHTSSATTTPPTNAPGYALVGNPAYWQQYFGAVVGDLYSGSVTYNAGDVAYTGTNPYIFYVSLVSSNTNNTPSSSPNDWVGINPTGNTTTLPLTIVLPAGPGFSVNSVARNIFPLPYGFLRFLPQDSKAPNAANLMASAGQRFTDWQPEFNYIISASTTPLLLRFIADVSDVLSMSPLFCENLAALLAREIAEPLTMSSDKFTRCAAAYTDLYTIATKVNYLETGATEVQEGAMNDDTQESRYPLAETQQPGDRGGGGGHTFNIG